MDSTQLALLNAGTRGALRALGTVATPTVETLAHPVETIDVSMTVTHLEEVFRPMQVASVAVLDPADSEVIGLITRERFMASMSGRLGYGRAVLARRTVDQITDWRPLVVEPEMLVSVAAIAAMSRPLEHRYDDVLVRARTWSVVSTSDLVHSLSTVLAVRSLHDSLTGLANRDLVLRRLGEHCAAVRGTGERVAVALLDLDRFGAVNDRFGIATGDGVLVCVASRLTRVAPASADLGRLSGDEFVLVVRFPVAPGADDVRRAQDHLLATLHDALEPPEDSLPAGAWCQVPITMAVSDPGAADADALLRKASRAMRATKVLTGGVRAADPWVPRRRAIDPVTGEVVPSAAHLS